MFYEIKAAHPLANAEFVFFVKAKSKANAVVVGYNYLWERDRRMGVIDSMYSVGKITRISKKQYEAR